MSQYLENVNEGYISNNADTQRNPAWKPIVDGLAVTVLTDDYIPSIILAEEESGQKKVVDGGSRTAAFMMLRYGNYKIKSSVENPVIKYKAMKKDRNGSVIWEDAEFDIRNKTFEQFPKELQKAFNEYQVETVIHECDSDGIAMYLRRYNIHTSMNANQKMFIYLPKFAGKVRDIANMEFFINKSSISDSEKEKGMLERIISESVMCMFHMNKWNKNGKTISTYLNDNATYEEFERLESNISRLENVITDDLKDIFSSKDSFIWLTLFNHFVDLGFKDSEFAKFLREFKDGLRNKQIDGKLFDTVDETGSTKDKSVVTAKLHILKTLMYEYLNIEEKDLSVENIFEFVKENVTSDVTESDIEDYASMLDLYIKLDEPINKEDNLPSLIAMISYACKNETDVELEDWFNKFTKENKTYIKYQKNNFLHMKKDFDCYLRKLKRVA